MKIVLFLSITFFACSVLASESTCLVVEKDKIKFLTKGEQNLVVSVTVPHRDETRCDLAVLTVSIFDDSLFPNLYYFRTDIQSLTKAIPSPEVARYLVKGTMHYFKKEIDVEELKYERTQEPCYSYYKVSKQVLDDIKARKLPIYSMSVAYESWQFITYMPELGQTIVVAEGGC